MNCQNIAPDDYSFKMITQGRSGDILYQEGDRALELDWEMSGTNELNILLAPVDLRKWHAPLPTTIPLDKQKEILSRLRHWLHAEGLRSDIDLPGNTELTSVPCVYSDCEKQSIKGSAYCLEHFDFTLLRT